MLSLFNKCAILSDCVAAVLPPQRPSATAFWGYMVCNGSLVCVSIGKPLRVVRLSQNMSRGRQGHSNMYRPFVYPGVFSHLFLPTVKTSLNRSTYLKGAGRTILKRQTQLNKADAARCRSTNRQDHTLWSRATVTFSFNDQRMTP